jgi:transmembrane sensor
MKFKKAEELLEKYRQKKATPKEKALLESWYLKYQTGTTLDPQDLLQEHNLGLNTLNVYLSKRQKIKLWPKLVAAAAMIMIFGTSVYFYSFKNRGIKDKISAAQDIPPGKNTAILSLANGRIINLSDNKKGIVINANKLTYSDGSNVVAANLNDRNTPPAVEMIARTPRGGVYNVILPDGTLVMLNAESSIKFPSAFKGKNRIVELTGEAYFEVAKDRAHPFMVKTEAQNTEVLGTHFNINSYETQHIKTTLLEGSIKVTGENDQVILIPGQQSTLAVGKLNVQQADIDEAVAWKNGYFRFNDEKIGEIMQKISRWYNIEVQYKDNITEEGFTGTISRFSNISDVLSMLERTKTVHFEIEGRRVTVLN